MVRRGRWTYQPEHAAWLLDDSGWYLQVRTGVMRVFRGCPYCWHIGDDRRWVLRTTPPGEWEEPRHRSELYDWQWWIRYVRYGSCTHRRHLAAAMPLVEKAFGEHVLKSLADL